MMEQKQKTRLDEVTLMRTVLAILIVFMHSFTIYQGGWTQPENYVDIPIYKWIARISFAFTLEAFVFISGYLFAFQRITLNRVGGVIDLVINKLKRLILPSVIFSLLYFPLFFDYNGLGDLIYNILNGCGHMWFLPMLFWCFIGCWLLEIIKLGDGYKLALLICLNLTFIFSLPFQLNKAAFYMVYFYSGYVVYKYSDSIKKWVRRRHIVIGWLLFAALFVIFRPLRDFLVVPETSNLFRLFLIKIANHSCQFIYASAGSLIFYLTTLYYTQFYEIKTIIRKAATTCFGVYLFQQFILKFMYYKTSVPAFVGPYMLPWVGFIITLPLSYLVTTLILRTKVGKFLIG